MIPKDPIEAEAKLIIDMYDYSLAHDLDIANKDDVRKILEALVQKNVTEDRFERLMLALAVTDKRVRKDVSERKKVTN